MPLFFYLKNPNEYTNFANNYSYKCFSRSDVRNQYMTMYTLHKNMIEKRFTRNKEREGNRWNRKKGSRNRQWNRAVGF